jgi:hypothetical protein
MEREIKIFSTLTRKRLNSSATTWSELQAELKNESIKFDNMKAAVGKSKVSLEYPEAQLPAEGFTLYLMPTKTKSGLDVENMSYSAIRAAIRQLVTTSENAHNHFNDEKNYTNKKADELRSLLASWLNLVDSLKQEKEEVIEKEKLEHKNAQAFVTTIIDDYKKEDGLTQVVTDETFLNYIIGQLTNFSTDKDHVANALRNAISVLQDALEDWTEEEKEFEELLAIANHENDEDDYEDEDYDEGPY